MEIYSSEEQQVEAIKRFWKHNGTAIIAGVVLGLAGLYGFRYYQAQQVTQLEAQSAQYAQLIEKLSEDGADKTAWLAAAQTFIEANKSSNYAVLTALLAAKEAVFTNNLAAAEQQLTWVLSATKSTELIAVATLRLARVQAEQGNTSAALATLNAELPVSFLAQQQELRGDVLLQTGDEAKAKAAYQAALAAGEAEKNPLLQVKLNELAHVAN